MEKQHEASRELKNCSLTVKPLLNSNHPPLNSLPFYAQNKILKLQDEQQDLESKLQKALNHPSKMFIPGDGSAISTEKLQKAIEQNQADIEKVYQDCEGKNEAREQRPQKAMKTSHAAYTIHKAEGKKY